MKFNYTEHNQGLAEIGQQLNTKFSFATKQKDGSYTNTMPWVKCRDFFGDVLLAVQTKKTQGIYGFQFNPNTQKFDTDKCRMLVQFVNEESKKAFLENLKFYRKQLNLITPDAKYGKVWEMENDPLVVLMVAPTIWQQSVAAISYYTFILKVLSYSTLEKKDNFWDAVENLKTVGKNWDGKDIGLVNTNESNYYKEAKENLTAFCKNLKKITENLKFVHGYEKEQNIGTVHNCAGFKAVCSILPGVIGANLKKAMNDDKQLAAA